MHIFYVIYSAFLYHRPFGGFLNLNNLTSKRVGGNDEGKAKEERNTSEKEKKQKKKKKKGAEIQKKVLC